EDVMALLDGVSRNLLYDAEARKYPDVATFAFFCRRAHLLQLAEQYHGRMEGRIGRGLVFHIAPSNVPINFAYTLVMGLLAGNTCVAKASSKSFPQTEIVAAAFREEIAKLELPRMRDRVFVVEYGRKQQDVTEAFSAICHVRVIWGGDATIRAVREAELPPRSFDVTFADRYSLAALSAATVLAMSQEPEKLRRLAQAFYNDTYLYDQNACSSPRLICWVGEPDVTEAARQAFWKAVHETLRNRYSVEPVVAVDKWTAACRTAIEVPGAQIERGVDNRIVRVAVPELTVQLPELRSAGGLYHEYAATSLEALAGIVDEKYQTLSYYGLDPGELRAFVLAHGLLGIDRIVPVGRTAEMGTVWDGQDFIETLSRIVALI
ncbi:MAG: acyl-CoA reductase, partial [Selenomonadaceae bacterium]|nr:acyl-CoA reductase [Selenomonadaceae bacterium]